jgi:hypothetical protein
MSTYSPHLQRARAILLERGVTLQPRANVNAIYRAIRLLEQWDTPDTVGVAEAHRRVRDWLEKSDPPKPMQESWRSWRTRPPLRTSLAERVSEERTKASIVRGKSVGIDIVEAA